MWYNMRYRKERGEGLKKGKSRRKLLIQVSLIIVPVFVLMTAAVVWVVYTSSVNSYLRAQERQTRDIMDEAMFSIYMTGNERLGIEDNVKEWFIEAFQNTPLDGSIEMTDEERIEYFEYMEQVDEDLYKWYVEMPDKYRVYVIKDALASCSYIFKNTKMNGGFDSLVFVSSDSPDKMRIVIDLNEERHESELGKWFELDPSSHKALSGALENGGEMVFEKTGDYLADGSYYIGYFPVTVGDKVRGAFGIVYKWDEMRQSVIHTTINAMVIIIIGMLLLMTALIVYLYRRAIKPVTLIQRSLIDYTDDKDTPEIVKRMYGIKADNELGDLADIISDMALEIDLYSKENTRIAVERERAQREAYEAKVAVMASQIRPHFMYNALTSIAMMCQIDPEKAQEATINFAKYLRGNMDSLKQTKPVPFDTELDHLKKYLYIEKLRFGKKLNIVYDIQTTNFKVPMLSVQPLVENAVKHGVGMKKKGGTVTISTSETDKAFIIKVADDGVGFDVNAPRADDGRSHVGMENTRSRLRDMCGAEIITESTVDVGTTATIILPKEEQDNENTVS